LELGDTGWYNLISIELNPMQNQGLGRKVHNKPKAGGQGRGGDVWFGRHEGNEKEKTPAQTAQTNVGGRYLRFPNQRCKVNITLKSGWRNTDGNRASFLLLFCLCDNGNRALIEL
jgi:hypothetical protein